MNRTKYTNFFATSRKYLSEEQLKRAHAKADAEVFAIRLAKLREIAGVNQSNIKGFTQSSISKLESRADMKISTLLEYLEALDMKVEIIVQSRKNKSKPISLLKKL